jgi:hypothetical protein
LQECDQQLQHLLADQPRPEQKAVAALVTGLVDRQHVALPQAAAGSPGVAQDPSKVRRAQRLVANPRLQLDRAQRRLAQPILARCGERLTLLLDTTVQGASAHQAGTVTLCLAVVWGGHALPLAWHTWAAGTPGAGSFESLAALLDTLVPFLPAEGSVLVLADRGLRSRRLATAAQARGWHFALRLTQTQRFQPRSGPVRTVGSLVGHGRTTVRLAHVRLWAPRRKVRSGAGGWVTDWDQGLLVNLVAHGHADDPWLLATDLPPTTAALAAYRQRMRIEELFRDLKSFGWQWQDSHVRAPDHVARLLLILALATVWMVSLGQQVDQQGLRRVLEGSRTCLSRFHLGLRWFLRCRTLDQPLPCTFALRPAPLTP